MIRTFEVNLNAAHPELRMFEAATFVGSPSTAFIRNVPPQVGAWRVTTVFVAVVNPDNTSATIEAKKGGDGVWTATIPATNTSGRVAGGFQVLADGIDENGDAVTGYVLGVADFTVFELEVTADPGRGGASSVLRYFATAPAVAKAGDVAKFDGVLKFYDGSAWIPFAEGGGGDLPAPVAPSEATEPGQYADALATEGELGHKANSAAVADAFDATQTYSVGAAVMYNGMRYECTTAVAVPGPWTGNANWSAIPVEAPLQTLKLTLAAVESVIAAMQSDIADKLEQDALAPQYSELLTYSVGTVVTHDGKFYRCIEAQSTPAPWEDVTAKWQETDAFSVIYSLLADKANAADLRYALVTKTIANDAVTLDDRAVNEVVVPTPASGATEVTLTLNLPAAVSGKARDLLVRLDLTAVPTTGVDISGISFASASGETATFEVKGNAWPENEVGKVNLWSFTETKDGSKWAVGRETLTAVTQGSGS